MDEVVLTSHESAAEESGDPGNERSSIGPVISIDQEASPALSRYWRKWRNLRPRSACRPNRQRAIPDSGKDKINGLGNDHQAPIVIYVSM